MSTSKRNRLSEEVRKTKAFYEKNAQLWAQRHANPFHHEKQFMHLLKLLPKRASVIDIGCASGLLVPLFCGVGRNLKYHGVDISKSFLTIAQRRFPQYTFTQGNIADKSTLPRKRFDGFLAVAVLMHVPFSEWDKTYTNLEKLVKPGGVGYVALPTAHPSGNKPPSTDTRHFTLLTEIAQMRYIKNRGWKILKKYALTGSNGRDIWRGYIVRLPS